MDCSGGGDECITASCDPAGPNGNCDTSTPKANGTPCGDQSSSLCDDPDTCDGAGDCQDNTAPDGWPADDGGQGTLAWGTMVEWAGGSAPTLTAAGEDWLRFYTLDDGTTWIGEVIALDVG